MAPVTLVWIAVQFQGPLAFSSALKGPEPTGGMGPVATFDGGRTVGAIATTCRVGVGVAEGEGVNVGVAEGKGVAVRTGVKVTVAVGVSVGMSVCV